MLCELRRAGFWLLARPLMMNQTLKSRDTIKQIVSLQNAGKCQSSSARKLSLRRAAASSVLELGVPGSEVWRTFKSSSSDKRTWRTYMLSGPGPPPPPPPPPPMVSPPTPPWWPPPPPLPQARAAARTCPCCRLGQSGICAAVVSRTRHELQLLNYEGCMAMVMVAAVSLMVLMMKMTTTIMMFSMMSKMIRLSTRVPSGAQHHEQYHRQQAQLRTRPTKASAGWGCTAHHNNETTEGAGKGTTTGPHPTGGRGWIPWGGGGDVAALHYICLHMRRHV